jgi:hypothetical protein
MSKRDGTELSRRTFVAAVCPALAGALTLSPSALRSQGQGQGQGFWGAFTPEERAVVQNSAMAQDVPNYLGKGMGCAEICLAASCKYMGVSQDWVDAAAVFSGGFGKGDLCGLLTGGLMALGIAGGKLHEDLAAVKQFARPLKDQYWEWWTARGSVHCAELRTRYDGSEQFLRMTQRATAKVEHLIQPARA